MILLICGILIRPYELIYKTEPDSQTQRRDVVARGKRNGEGMDCEFGTSRCKLLYIGWIKNKLLLYSTGNYIQYPLINLNGKEHRKECVCVYIHMYI